MTTPDQWREKCLSALDEQDRLERLVADCRDYIRRLAIHLGAAASGLDRDIDRSVEAFKQGLRESFPDGMSEPLVHLERAVGNFDDERHRLHTQILSELSHLVEQLRGLPHDQDVKAALSSLQRRLKKHPYPYAEFPALLQEIAQLQKQALVATGKPKEKTGWLAQKRELLQRDSIEVKPQEAPAAEEATQLAEPDPEHCRTKARELLSDVLAAIMPSPALEERLSRARLRLRPPVEGWAPVVETLEDLREILLEGYLRSDREFADYLTRIHLQLRNICESLGLKNEQQRAQREAAVALQQKVSEQMSLMRDSVRDVTNFEDLKFQISHQIEIIGEALTEFQQHREAPLGTTDFIGLIERLHSIEQESQQTKALLEKQRQQAIRDPLTELPNRQGWDERVALEWNRMRRYGTALSLAVCDVDNFKSFNDNYGHQVGDRVLKLVAKALSTRLRETDFIARYGGEEFVLLMPETALASAHQTLDNIRAAIAGAPFRYKDQPVRLTLSFGVTEFAQGDSVEQAFARADEAMYKAKRNGRNQVVSG